MDRKDLGRRGDRHFNALLFVLGALAGAWMLPRMALAILAKLHGSTQERHAEAWETFKRRRPAR